MNNSESKPELKVVRTDKDRRAPFLGQKYMILLAVTFIIVALDQFTKMLVHSTFDLGETIPVIKNYFNLTYVRNLGAAFGIFGNLPSPFRQIFFLSIPPLAIFFIILFMRSTPSTDKLQVYALSLISGGAIGNYVDRMRFGYVIDFLDFHWQEKYSWPAFNVADSSIVIGVAITMLLVFRSEKNKAPAST